MSRTSSRGGFLVRRASADLPDLVPILSRGKHRSPRKGACFMEMASYLAGERWSDHPRCTHPLLASVARLVNDLTSGHQPAASGRVDPVGDRADDEGSPRRRPHRPAVRDDGAADRGPASVRTPSPWAVLAAERALANFGGSSPRSPQRQRARGRWTARRWRPAGRAASPAASTCPSRGFRRFGAPNAVRVAVPGIAEACVPDPDDRLRELLVAVIGECAAVCGSQGRAEDPVDAEV